MFRWLAKFINTLIHYANCNESLLSSINVGIAGKVC